MASGLSRVPHSQALTRPCVLLLLVLSSFVFMLFFRRGAPLGPKVLGASSGKVTGGDSASAATVDMQMPKKYDFAQIEPKWQRRWQEEKTFATPERDSKKQKKYILDMFPYPSGAGLHVGHPEGYTASDVMARYYRMKGYDVLHPMGWDSFGLPAEQHAINTGTHPAVTTEKNIANFKRQLSMLGFSYDWDREIATTDEKFVKWTQWIFLQLFKKGLATQSEVSVNWCPALGTVLANEEVIDGLSERGDHPVKRLPLRQWVLKITEYGDKLLEDLEGLDWPEGTLTAQKTWIGRSEGAEIDFQIAPADASSVEEKSTDAIHQQQQPLTVFTTRPDTLLGVTYVCIAPEHPLVDALTTDDNKEKVREYVSVSNSKSDLERTAQGAKAKKTGVPTGSYAIHPITEEKVPIWVADYVLGGYGSGAVMAVPAHDERDMAFAQTFGLPIKQVIEPAAQKGGEKKKNSKNQGEAAAGDEDGDGRQEAFTEDGILTNSGEFNGITSAEARKAIIKHLVDNKKGSSKVQYKLRDWVFSRQRYWGDEHEILFNDPRPVPEEDLPLKLPEMENFQPGEDPQGCLARAIDWRYFQKDDGQWYARETNTMPQWAGSCWYYLRFIDPHNVDEPWSKEADNSWMPVDLYVGGQEHATLHLLYSRFWHKVLFEAGLTKSKEPFQKLVHQGMILGSDGEKMSKSRGNVVNPDDVVDEHGADALRMYEMFMGPLEATKPWQTEQVAGVVRFRDKVTKDIESLSFNTAISALMVETLTLLASPFAPHLGEECWSLLGHEDSLAYFPWPTYDEKQCVDSTVKIGVQVNGKKRGEMEIEKDASEETAKEMALALPRVAELTQGKELKKFIYRPGKIVNVVVGK
eukprot:jgi/Bigna1/57435/fgenesh1_pm.14_\